MRKVIFTLLVLLIGTELVNAQFLKKVQIGAFFKPANSWLRAENSDITGEGKVGWSLGLVCDQNIGDRYFLTTGIEYTKVNTDLRVMEVGFTETSLMNYKLGYLQIPFAFKGKTREIINYFSVFGQVGVTASILADGRYSRTRPIGNDIENERIMDVVRPFAGSWHLAAGVEYETVSSTILFLAVHYDRSFTDVLYPAALHLPNDDDKVTYGHLGLRFGLFF